MIMLCQWKFISYKKRTNLIRDIDNTGSYACVGTGIYGKSPSFLLNFAINLKFSPKSTNK